MPGQILYGTIIGTIAWMLLQDQISVIPQRELVMPNRRVSRLSSRRRSANDPPRKPGWQVRSSVADAVRQAVDEGAAESQNAFVERALVRELRELRRRRVYDAYAAAAEDPSFTEEVEEVTREFEAASRDGLVGHE